MPNPTFAFDRFYLSHGTLCAEASDLQLPPGQPWPLTIIVIEERGRLTPYGFQKQDEDQNAFYVALSNTKHQRLTIFND